MESSKYVYLTGDEENPTQSVEVTPIGDDRFVVRVGDQEREVLAYPVPGGVSFLDVERSVDARIDRRGRVSKVQIGADRVDVELVDDRIYRMEAALGGGAGAVKPELTSPMAGKVVMTQVNAGDEVAAGETLVIIEAMKMENEIRADHDVVIKSVNVAAGDVVNPGDVLITFAIEDE